MRKLALMIGVVGLATVAATMPAQAHGGWRGHRHGGGINFSFGFFDSCPRYYYAPEPVVYYPPPPVYYYPAPAYYYYRP